MNLFFIGTPLQLLNAVEARHHFKFSNNHLVIALDLHFWPKTQVFKRLIRREEWESIRYVTLYKTTIAISPQILGKFTSTKLKNFFYKYHQYRNKSALDRIARSFPVVENLILGNYHRDQSRHFPNLLKYDNLYLVDDGTDVLYISRERRSPPPVEIPPVNGKPMLVLPRLRQKINRSLRWDNRQADEITFFSAYNIAAGHGDTVIKNDYEYFSSHLAPARRQDSCLFLGQCLVRDGYCDENQYLGYLEKVRAYFRDREVFYVPHPRESNRMVDQVQQRLGFVIRRFELPIEWQLMSDSTRPAVLASFFCSALVTCAAIFRRELKLKAFYIPPQDVRKWREFVADTYDYFSNEMASSIEVVRA